MPDFLTEYTRTPEFALGPHVAALGLTFTREGARMGDGFGQGAFVARHGSWNRKPPAGYDVVFVKFDARGNPVGKPVPVLKSFLAGGGDTHGRPTWVAWDKTGALLVSDDTGNIIWRVQAPGAKPAAAPQRTQSARMPPQRELRGDPRRAFEQSAGGYRSGGELTERLAGAPGELGDEMPRDAARARAAAAGPLERFGFGPVESVFGGVAAHDREELVLRARVEAERQAEAVGQRELVVGRVARAERIVLLARLARDDRTPVRGDREPHVARPGLDPAVEPAPQVPRAGRYRRAQSRGRRRTRGSAGRPGRARRTAPRATPRRPSPPAPARCGPVPPSAPARTAARTSADLPIPREPHSSMSCAACPRASRSTFSATEAFCRSIPRSSSRRGASIRAIARAP